MDDQAKQWSIFRALLIIIRKKKNNPPFQLQFSDCLPLKHYLEILWLLLSIVTEGDGRFFASSCLSADMQVQGKPSCFWEESHFSVMLHSQHPAQYLAHQRSSVMIDMGYFFQLECYKNMLLMDFLNIQHVSMTFWYRSVIINYEHRNHKSICINLY